MFTKNVDGPTQVTLPGSRVISRADLPAHDTSRWVASRKALVVLAVANGLITEAEAHCWYDLSEEEFAAWCLAVERHGKSGLKVTTSQKYRQL